MYTNRPLTKLCWSATDARNCSASSSIISTAHTLQTWQLMIDKCCACKTQAPVYCNAAGNVVEVESNGNVAVGLEVTIVMMAVVTAL